MKIGNYHFLCRFKTPARLPYYKGSTFRGVFGRALKRVVCALRMQECNDCILRNQCLYVEVFETPYLPHPFLIEPPLTPQKEYAPESPFDFKLLLFGHVNAKLAYFVYAFKEMGKIGIGSRVNGQRGLFKVEYVKHQGTVLYDGKEEKITILEIPDSVILAPRDFPEEKRVIKVRLITPLRLKYQNRLSPELPFHILVRAILRRLSSLWETYGDGEPELDYQGLVKAAKGVRILEDNISWFDWRRYSFRQDKAMLMGGVVGSIIYEGNLAPYLPLLELAQVVHIGKQTTFGLGKIAVEILL